jgi:cytochrome c553
MGFLAPEQPHQFSKFAGQRAALQCAIVTILFSTGAHAEIAAKGNVPKQELKAKMTYCENCHGASAQGFRGYYSIPRLAGQQPDYIKNQLEAFVEHRRTNNIMFNVAHVLSPAMLDALTESFQSLNPKPLTMPAAEDLIAAGKKVYDEGLANSDVPPCAGCHGPDAKGNGQFPRSRPIGRLHRRQTDQLGQRTGPESREPRRLGHYGADRAQLEPAAIKAVAAYLNQVE